MVTLQESLSQIDQCSQSRSLLCYCNIFEQWTFFCSRTHVLSGCRTSHTNLLLTCLRLLMAQDWSWSSCGRQSVDQYVWVSGLPLGSLTRFYLALLPSFDNYVVLLSMRPLWRENGSVIYCTIASGPCQSNHTWAEVPQNSRPYLTVSSETPPTWRARFSACVFLL
jgi:hypothetical protein